MPFDADLTPQAAPSPLPAQMIADRLMGALADPDPKWARADPARLLAYLFISPRPCPALDALIAEPV
jgi:hypothetical protein